MQWNLTEDELLIKAVSAHGQRWDAVAAAVPTRCALSLFLSRSWLIPGAGPTTNADSVFFGDSNVRSTLAPSRTRRADDRMQRVMRCRRSCRVWRRR